VVTWRGGCWLQPARARIKRGHVEARMAGGAPGFAGGIMMRLWHDPGYTQT